MENNKPISLNVKTGNKNGRDWYILVITHHYSSGKTFKESVFINKNEYDYLKNIFNK